MENKFKPFDIKTYCRVYLAFLNKDNKKDTCYYERYQFMTDHDITSEALIIAEDMKNKLCGAELLSVYVARTPEQVKEYEATI